MEPVGMILTGVNGSNRQIPCLVPHCHRSYIEWPGYEHGSARWEASDWPLLILSHSSTLRLVFDFMAFSPRAHCTGDWLSPRTGLDDLEKRVISCVCRESNTVSSRSLQSHGTYRAIPSRRNWRLKSRSLSWSCLLHVYLGLVVMSALQTVFVTSLLVFMQTGCLSVRMPLCCCLQSESGSLEVRKQEVLLSSRPNAEMITSSSNRDSLGSCTQKMAWCIISSVLFWWIGTHLCVFYRNLDQLLHCWSSQCSKSFRLHVTR